MSKNRPDLRTGLAELDRPRTALLAAALTAALLPGMGASPLAGQQQGWNSTRVLDLIEQARERRAQPYRDSALVNYQAEARGYIYFYLDREDTDERTLVKVDQVALEVFWAYPGSTRQRIVGLRDESVLPNRMRYHLDHLTVVQNEFGDRIRLGDGDEVRSVVHPVAPGSERIYDFRLADSLTLRLGGLPEPLRVLEVEVRPRDPGEPAIVGSIFLDAARSDIVRMDFTFTRASYVDRRLDYIRISLENGLWQGRFWLPFEQRAELRRQLPQLDFPAGAIIRANMRVGEYAFNQPLPEAMFRGPTVTAVPRAAREAFPFEEELFAELSEEGLEPDPDLEALREEAAELVGSRFLRGLPMVRLDLRGASSVLRFNRTERLHLGAGISYRAGESVLGRLGAGYAFGTGEPNARAGIRFRTGAMELTVDGWYNQPRDLGYPSISGVINTLGSLAAAAGAGAGHDFLDTWFVRGGRLAVAMPAPLLPGWEVTLAGAAVRELDARSLVDDYVPDPDDELNRPLATIDDGLDLRGAATLRRRAASETARRWDATLELAGGAFDPSAPDGTGGREAGAYGRGALQLQGWTGPADRSWRLASRLRLGVLAGDPPLQRHFLLGGRGTVPGYPYRSFVGDRSVLAEATFERSIRAPWLRARVTAAVGWTGLSDDSVLSAWPGTGDGMVGPSLGVGVGLFHDILWLDLHRGLDGGDWELLLSADPGLRDIL